MENSEKKKFRWRVWLLADLIIAVVIIIFFLHKPAYFKPSNAVDSNEVSTYLTHELSPQFYNGVQLQEPFSLIVHQNRLNDAIARFGWPKESEGIRFSTPIVFFVPDRIVLMTEATLMGMKLVVTIESEASIDKKGLLNLDVVRVKVGAVSVTFLAKIVAKRMYAQQLASIVDREDFGSQIAGAILNDEPFEPVFEVEDKKVRIERVSIMGGALTIRFVPVSE